MRFARRRSSARRPGPRVPWRPRELSSKTGTCPNSDTLSRARTSSLASGLASYTRCASATTAKSTAFDSLTFASSTPCRGRTSRLRSGRSRPCGAGARSRFTRRSSGRSMRGSKTGGSVMLAERQRATTSCSRTPRAHRSASSTAPSSSSTCALQVARQRRKAWSSTSIRYAIRSRPLYGATE